MRTISGTGDCLNFNLCCTRYLLLPIAHQLQYLSRNGKAILKPLAKSTFYLSCITSCVRLPEFMTFVQVNVSAATGDVGILFLQLNSFALVRPSSHQ